LININADKKVGKQINTHQTHLYDHIEKALLSLMAKTTLKKFAHQFD